MLAQSHTTVTSIEERVNAAAHDIGITDAIWRKFMATLGELKTHNEFMYLHSLRVGLYALGIAANEKQADRHFALFAGCGHDIGKCEVSNELLDSKNLQPEEFELIKKHAVEGFTKLKDSFLFTAFVAGLHHKFKPGGYGINLDDVAPFELSTDQKAAIEAMAKLVMLTDFFDALTTRNNNKGLINDPSNPVQQHEVMTKYFPDQPERISWLVSHRIV